MSHELLFRRGAWNRAAVDNAKLVHRVAGLICYLKNNPGCLDPENHKVNVAGYGYDVLVHNMDDAVEYLRDLATHLDGEAA